MRFMFSFEGRLGIISEIEESIMRAEKGKAREANFIRPSLKGSSINRNARKAIRNERNN
jgi:hypothetical protein